MIRRLSFTHRVCRGCPGADLPPCLGEKIAPSPTCSTWNSSVTGPGHRSEATYEVHRRREELLAPLQSVFGVVERRNLHGEPVAAGRCHGGPAADISERARLRAGRQPTPPRFR